MKFRRFSPHRETMRLLYKPGVHKFSKDLGATTKF